MSAITFSISVGGGLSQQPYFLGEADWLFNKIKISLPKTLLHQIFVDDILFFGASSSQDNHSF